MNLQSLDCISKCLDPFGTILHSQSSGLILMVVLSSRPLSLSGWRLLLHASVQEVQLPASISLCSLYNRSCQVRCSSFGSQLPQTGLLNDWWRSVFQRLDQSGRLQRSRRPVWRAEFFSEPQNSRVSANADKIHLTHEDAEILT